MIGGGVKPKAVLDEHLLDSSVAEGLLRVVLAVALQLDVRSRVGRIGSVEVGRHLVPSVGAVNHYIELAVARGVYSGSLGYVGLRIDDVIRALLEINLLDLWLGSASRSSSIAASNPLLDNFERYRSRLIRKLQVLLYIMVTGPDTALGHSVLHHL